MAHLIEIYLPLADNSGRPFDRQMFRAVEDRLTATFDGFTSFSRSPASGIWRSATEEIVRDDIIVYEVLTDDLDSSWWTSYRAELERKFAQDKILIRAHHVTIL